MFFAREVSGVMSHDSRSWNFKEKAKYYVAHSNCEFWQVLASTYLTLSDTPLKCNCITTEIWLFSIERVAKKIPKPIVFFLKKPPNVMN